MWNNRVEVTKTEMDDYTEFSASIIEVYYEPNAVGNTGEIAPMGTGETEREAILDLKAELERMLDWKVKLQYIIFWIAVLIILVLNQ